MRATERATRAGSSGSFQVGLPVLTLQKPQRRVQVSPRIMNVAVPRSQHSPMFGQAASWQTVCSDSALIISVSSRYFGPPGSGTLNHGGLRPRNGSEVSPSTLVTSIPPGLARERVWWIRSGVSLTSPAYRQARRGPARPSRSGVTSRWRWPNASAKRCAHALAEAGEVVGGTLLRDRGHRDRRQPAGDHPRERRQVVGDVDREAVRGHPAREVHADRGDLAVLDPHAGVVAALGLPRARLDPGLGERGDDRALHRAHEHEHVVDAHDRIADQLAGAVVGQLAAARGLDDVDALGAAPVLAHRQVAGLRAAPERVDGLVLEQQHRLVELTREDLRAQLLLDLHALLVGDAAEVADEQIASPHRW